MSIYDNSHIMLSQEGGEDVVKLKQRILIAIGVVLSAVALYLIGTAIGSAIYQLRYFSNLPIYTGDAPEPTGTCIICDYVETNHPCVVNLITGKMGEIVLYDTRLLDRTQINASKTEYGVMRSGAAASAHFYSFPDEHWADISIQREYLFKYSEDIAERYLCETCMEKVRELSPETNFIFVDLYDRDNIAMYRLEDADNGISIRHYNIIMERKSQYSVKMKMTSTFFTGNGSELDY